MSKCVFLYVCVSGWVCVPVCSQVSLPVVILIYSFALL